MSKTLFSKIAAGEIPADIIHEDELAVAFRDIDPKAPVHILVIPRQPITSLAGTDPADQALLGHCLQVCAKVAKQEGVEENGYRVVTNIGKDGGQSIFHLHFHVLGGRTLQWPPG